MDRVFSVFGYPLLMVTDNGPAFTADLQKEMAQYYGFRHVPILPYNANANGTAEASVKRIKTLLDRHTKKYADWHRILPLAQLVSQLWRQLWPKPLHSMYVVPFL